LKTSIGLSLRSCAGSAARFAPETFSSADWGQVLTFDIAELNIIFEDGVQFCKGILRGWPAGMSAPDFDNKKLVEQTFLSATFLECGD
jgi:hypothetical protein